MNSMNYMKKLIQQLNEASKAYYQEDRQIMSDFEYDKLYDELCQLEKSSGVVLSNSPTKNVGYTVLSNLVKVAHESKMLSLDKTKEVEKLKNFLSEGDGVLSWKLDGLTIVLKYDDGKLVQAVTRGNGEIGEDVTHNAGVFKNLPVRIKHTGRLTLRGEAVISYPDFEKINEALEDGEKYKNPRNLCSGTVRQLNSEIAASRNVMFYGFAIVNCTGADLSDSKHERLLWLQENGFDTVYSKRVTMDTIETAVRSFEESIKANDFASDGLVLTYESVSFSAALGATSKFPKDSIAFKWADELSETILLSVEWNTSRTGLINPIAIFEPVELEGTTVNKASLHNVSYIEGLELGVGDRITVYKANMIIPQIAENLTRSGVVEIPKHCPVCGSEAQVIKQKEGKALYCINLSCKAQLVRGLTHFVSRDAMNIDGFSESTIEKFVDSGFIHVYTDIYSLNLFANEIMNMEGLGEKSYNNLISAIEKSKKVQLPNFLYALGINQVGLSNAKLLCKHFSYDIEKIRMAAFEQLEAIEGFGQVIAGNIVKFFADDKNSQLLNKALEILNIEITDQVTDEKQPLLIGKTFVVTGDVTRFSNRKELKQYIEANGGKVTSSVTSKTSYLINNDLASGSSKNKKAKELNIPIITEEEFMKLVGTV